MNDSLEELRNPGSGDTADYPSQKAEVLRRRLVYYFLNPIEKWQAKRKFPFKLTVQVIKVIIVAVHIISQGLNSHRYQLQRFDTEVTFRHLFLNNWDEVRDIVSYPPSTGPYAAYTQSEVFENMDFAIIQYAFFTKINVGTFGYDNDNNDLGTMIICTEMYKTANAFPNNFTLQFDDTKIKKCIPIPKVYPKNDPLWRKNFTITDVLRNNSMEFDFAHLIRASLHFHLRAMYLRQITTFNAPDCFNIGIEIVFDNSLHESNIPITLLTKNQRVRCNYILDNENQEQKQQTLRFIFDGIVIGICGFSLVLCMRSIISGQQLRNETVKFFARHLEQKLPFEDRVKFLDLWYLMIIVNDILIITGTVIKIQMERETPEGDLHNDCSILLGLGTILVFAGLLRYLGFFHKYNILILTIKRAMPNIMRFMLCALLIYGGFCICGWLVLGPYHIKFMTLSTASECLFAMMNGDDLFATFAIIDTRSDLIWWFSRFFLYTFISLFIYIVISLFISVIMEAHDTVKNTQDHGWAPTLLEAFMNEGTEISLESYRGAEPDPCITWLRRRINLIRYPTGQFF